MSIHFLFSILMERIPIKNTKTRFVEIIMVNQAGVENKASDYLNLYSDRLKRYQLRILAMWLTNYSSVW